MVYNEKALQMHEKYGGKLRTESNVNITFSVLLYEISDLLPRVDFVVDITETFNHKKKAYKKYFSQHNIIGGMWEHIDGLTKVRGYMVGTKRGEAFMRVSSTPILI